jgi:hypothetical protein
VTRTPGLLFLIGAVAVAGFVGWVVRDRAAGALSRRTEPTTAEPGPPADDDRAHEHAIEPISDSADQEARRVAVIECMRKINAPEGGVDPAELKNALRAALESRDSRAAASALTVLCGPARSDLRDRSEFRNFVLPYLDDDDAVFRAIAVSALHACGPHASDRPLVLRLAEDADAQVRAAVALHVGSFFARDCTDAEASDAVLSLLHDEERVVAAAIVGLRHVTVSHEVEARLIALSEDARYRERVVFESLSRLEPKSDQVVDALVRIVQADRGEARRSATWGLRRGVPPAAQPRVAEAMLGVLSETTYDDTVTDCVDLVVAYGNAAQLDLLKSVATDLRQPERKRRYIASKLRLPGANEGD